MGKYRKKPVIIDAILLDESCLEQLEYFIDHRVRINYNNPLSAEILTFEGIIKASEGDYIIKGVNGEFYPCKPDIFKRIYEAV